MTLSDEARKARNREASLRWYYANREKVLARIKESGKTYREANREKERARGKVYRESNKEKVSSANRVWYQANLEKATATRTAYREANREKVLERQRARYRSNPEKMRIRVKAWTEANPERMFALKKRASGIRRAREANAPVVEAVDIEVLANRDQWTCGICGQYVETSLRFPDPWSKTHDHVVALADGGDHSYGNAQLAHLICNQRKPRARV